MTDKINTQAAQFAQALNTLKEARKFSEGRSGTEFMIARDACVQRFPDFATPFLIPQKTA